MAPGEGDHTYGCTAVPGQGRAVQDARPPGPDPHPRAALGARPRGARAARADRDRAEQPVPAARGAAAYVDGRVPPHRQRGGVLGERPRGPRPAAGRPHHPVGPDRGPGRARDRARRQRLLMGGRTGAGVAELLPQAADWRPFRPGADLTAGLMVGLVALPLALGFGASSGLGAGAGLVTAIVAGAVAALFGGIPATAAIARTAVNVRSGATTRLASLSHSVVLLAVVLVAARWVAEIPLAALAGVLVATAFQMVRLSSVAALLRATRGDAAVLVVTAVATVAVDLVTAVIVGLVVAGFFALRQTALAARLDEVPLEEGTDGPDDTTHADEERRLLDQHIVAYGMEGPLFFAAAHDFLLELSEASDVRVVVLRMSRLSTIDATGASVLADTMARLEGRGITVLLSGLQPRHDKVLRELGVFDRLGHDRHLFATTPEAIAHARQHVAREQHTHDTSEPHHA
ncbi:Sulfate transporter/antisigma-factor antagonist STAS [Nocardioides sp. JS614]|nr:Sulfate transporter/antisigma-factor antagonist STAS [Nocardioides sp. JS614]